MDTVRIIDTTRNQDIMIIGDTDQTTIKHPVGSSRKCKAIVHNIGTVLLNRPNMCRLNFRAPAPIY